MSEPACAGNRSSPLHRHICGDVQLRYPWGYKKQATFSQRSYTCSVKKPSSLKIKVLLLLNKSDGCQTPRNPVHFCHQPRSRWTPPSCIIFPRSPGCFQLLSYTYTQIIASSASLNLCLKTNNNKPVLRQPYFQPRADLTLPELPPPELSMGKTHTACCGVVLNLVL